MADKKKAAPSGPRETTYDSYLLIDKTKRLGLIVTMVILFAAMTYVLSSNIANHHPWVLVILPILLLGIPIMFFPPVEQWIYKPWQSKNRKYERLYRE